MTEKPASLIREQALTKSIINEMKDKLSPKDCAKCKRSYRPISRYSLFCSKCRKRVVS